MPRLLVGRSDLVPTESWGTAQGATVRCGTSFHVTNSRTYTRLVTSPSIPVDDSIPIWTTPSSGFIILAACVTITASATASVAPGWVDVSLYTVDNTDPNLRVSFLTEVVPSWDSETTWTVDDSPGTNTRFLASGGGGSVGGTGTALGNGPYVRPAASAGEFTPLIVLPYAGSERSARDSDVYLGVRTQNSCTITLPYRVDIMGMYFG